MSAMEDSLRRALEAGDARDPGFRESIYAASERALERMLETRGSDEAEALAQRRQLAETINLVEADYAAAGAPDAPEAAHDDAPIYDEPDEARAPRAFAADDLRDTVDRDDGDAHETWTPGGATPAGAPAPRSSPFAVPVVAVVIAILLGLLAYVVGGMLRGDATPADAAGQESELPALAWIDVFDGDDLQSLSTPNGGRVETIPKADGRSAVRASGPEGGEGEIQVDIGPGVTRELAGQNVRIELTAGSPDGSPREFGVRCLFAGTSSCDRQRFTTSMNEEAFVFDVQVPTGAAAGGSLALSPGLDGTPSDVDIYRVRVLRLS